MADLDEKKVPAEKEDKKAAKKPAKEKKPFGERLSHFFRGYKSELKKIVWSPWKQVRKNSLVVFVVVVACTAIICALDLVFSQGILTLGGLF
jgi:preprotein translocase SecE subunit